MSSLAERIDLLELDLRRVERELAALRREARPVPTAMAEPDVRLAEEPVAAQVRVPPPRPTPQAAAPSAPPRPRRERSSVDIGALLARSDLLGARGLAIAGGSVTALGITLLFALAAERGWIGPLERVAAGALVSTLVFGAGLVAHRRYGQVVAGLAAVGAGIAGGYATLAAAAALYELVPDPAALTIAAAIAGVAVVVSLAWGSELVAALGLIGAALAPALEAADTEIGAIGLAFGVVVLAATSAIAVHRRWELLLAAVLGVVGAEAVWLVAVVAGSAAAETLAVVATLAAVVLATACAWQVTGGERAVARLAGPMVLADLGLLLLTGQALLDAGSDRGAWLAFAAVSFALFWVVLRSAQPDFALLLAAGSLALAAVAVANLVSGDGLTLSWAGQSVVLTLLAYRFRDVRLQLAALAYLGLATAHLVADTEPLDQLFRADADWSIAIPTVAVGAAAAAAGLLAPRAYGATGEAGMLKFVASIRAALLRRRAGIVETLLAGAAALGVAAFGILAVSLDMDAGHVALSGVAALVAVAGTVVASSRRAPGLAAASLVASFVVVAEATAYDLVELPAGWGGPSLLLAAAGLLASGVLLRVRWMTPVPLGLASGAAAITAFVGSFVALTVLVPDDRELASRLWATTGSAAIATVYLGLAARSLRQPRLRNLATTLWSLGLVALLVAELAAMDGGQAFAIVVAVTATVTAVVADALRELRLWIAAAVLLSADCVGVLIGLTPPEHLLTANAAPASGVAALVAVAAATVALALTAPRRRRWLLAGAAGLGLYAVSLMVLALAIRVSGASLETDFERGHTVVGAVWGLTGLAVLVVGLSRRSNQLRYAGLALFGLTLAKIFLFDLAELSSVARAASFVAVGGLLLAGGLLVQRLDERDADILER
jgi:hypothetical protein